MLLLTPLIALTGCASVDPSVGFAEVQATVAAHGVPSIHWRTGTDADDAVDANIRTLLSGELSVDKAIQVAILNNRELQAAYEELRISQADVVAAGLLKNPVFDGSVRFVEGSNALELGVAMEFLDVLFLAHRQEIAQEEFEAAKLRTAGAVIDMSGMVRVAFLDLQAAQESLALRRQIEEAMKLSFDLAVMLQKAGNTTDLAVARERLAYEESGLDVSAAEALVTERRESLNMLMGAFGDTAGWSVTATIPDASTDPIDAAALENSAIEKSLDLRLAVYAMGAEELRADLARPLGWLSELEAGVTTEREDGDWTSGLSWSLPIPLFSQGQPSIAKADAAFDRASHLYFAMAVRVRSTVRMAIAQAIAAQTRAARLRDAILPLHHVVVEETQERYNAMLIGAFDLFQAKRDQLAGEEELVKARRDYWVARAHLDQLAEGRLASIDSSPETASHSGRTTKESH